MATITVGSTGKDYTTINAAIDAAVRGDVIVVEAGETFTEDVVLDYKATGTGYVIIQSSALASLPTAGNRVAPSDAANMPTIRSTSAGATSAISTVSGANPTGYYKLIGLNILRHDSTSQQTAVVSIGTTGTSQDSIDEMPHNIIIDRCLIRGSDTGATRRGIRLDAKDSQVINSYIDNFWETGTDSQAILMLNGGQNVLIANNFLEGASENILTGGGDPSITNFSPNNITIEHNHFFKRLAWVGASKAVKNLLELKNATDITIRNNIFENCWADAQSGNAINLVPVNQGGTASWSTVQRVTFEYNIIKGAGIIWQIATAYDNTATPMDDLTISNNLALIESAVAYFEWPILISPGANNAIGTNITFTHNTIYGEIDRISLEPGTDYLDDFIVTHNIFSPASGSAGPLLGGSVPDTGTVGLNVTCINWTWEGNVHRITQGAHPDSNYYPASVAAIDFVNAGSLDLELAGTSPYKGVAPGGVDPGVNWDELQSRTQNVEAGTNYSGGVLPTTPATSISGGLSISGGVSITNG